MRSLSIAEYQTQHGVALTNAEVVALRGLNSVIGVVPSLDMSGGFDVTATSWIGVIDLGTIAIEVRPKVPLAHILFMISYSHVTASTSDSECSSSASLSCQIRRSRL